jgi:hypothetical protein
MTFQLMRMQSDPSVEESDLNDLRCLLCCKVEELPNVDQAAPLLGCQDRCRHEEPLAAAAAAVPTMTTPTTP